MYETYIIYPKNTSLKRNRKNKKDSVTSAKYYNHEKNRADIDTAIIEVNLYGVCFGN